MRRALWIDIFEASTVQSSQSAYVQFIALLVTCKRIITARMLSTYSPWNVGQQGPMEGRRGECKERSVWVRRSELKISVVASKHFVPSQWRSTHIMVLNYKITSQSHSQDSAYVIARIHCVIAQIAYNAHCAFRDCVYISLWIIDNASLKVLSGISCWNASSCAGTQ